MVAAAASAKTQRTPASWRDDPDRYIRVVRGGKYQARPYDYDLQGRENLGLFHTRDQARKAIREYWAGKRKPLPKFVRRAFFRNGDVKYYALVPDTDRSGGRKWLRVGGPQMWHATPEEAYAAGAAHLRREYGLFAEVLLSRTEPLKRRPV